MRKKTYKLINFNVVTGIWMLFLSVYLVLHGINFLAQIGQIGDHLLTAFKLFLAALSLVGIYHFRKYHMDDVQGLVPWSVDGFWFVLCWIVLILISPILFLPIQIYFILSGMYVSAEWTMQRFFHRHLPYTKLWKSNTLRTVACTPATHIWPSPEKVPARSTLSLSERFAQWQALSQVEPIAEDAVKIAGEEGERAVLNTLQKHRSLKGSYLYVNKRIPNTQRVAALLPGKRAEIDLILLTPSHIHVIEVKNWSGRLEPDVNNPDAWVRQLRRDPEPKPYANVVAVNALKVLSLKNYLGQQGIPVAETQLRNYVFFTNTNLSLAKTIAQMPEIVTVDAVSRFSAKVGMRTLDKIILQLARVVLEREHADQIGHGLCEAFPEPLHTALEKALDNLPTWDRLVLHGGREVTGDFHWAEAWGSRCLPESLQRGHYYQIAWQYNKYLALIYTLFGWSLGKINDKVQADPNGQLQFHAAGQPKPEIFPLAQITRIEKG